MLDIHKPPPSSDTKTFFSHSLLPAYIDAANAPLKKKPLSAFHAVAHAHTLDLVLPPEVWDVVRAHLAQHSARVYARAWLKLSDVLDEPFLDAYVRNGSASLLGAGRPRVDTRMQVVAGVLRLEMATPLYERAGLVGRPLEDGGAKHKRARWVVEVDLKAQSMRKGKKGFERLRWAAREVLDESLAWLFCSRNASFAESVRDGREELCRHAPEIFPLQPDVETLGGVLVPKLDVQGNGLSALYDQDDALALLEWLDMLSLGSPRVRDGNALDGHLCRYDVPDFGLGAETRGLVRVRWRGFITPELATDLFLDVWNAGFKGKREPKRRKTSDQDGDVTMESTQDVDAEKWFSMSAQAFGGGKAWSLMQFASRETLVWEVEG